MTCRDAFPTRIVTTSCACRLARNTADTHHGRHLLHRFSAQMKVYSTYKDEMAIEEDIRSGKLAATGKAAQRRYHAPLRNGWLYESQRLRTAMLLDSSWLAFHRLSIRLSYQKTRYLPRIGTQQVYMVKP